MPRRRKHTQANISSTPDPSAISPREPVIPKAAEMDNSNKLNDSLEVLGLENFEGVSLNQLFDAITSKLPSDESKTRILSIYVMWLHPRLMAIDVSAEGSLTKQIATWYQFLKTITIHDHLIFEAFHDWQGHQAIVDPTSSRRLSIAEAELRRLMTAPSTSVKPSAGSPKPEGLFGQMHPDRLKLSQEPCTVIEIEDDEDDNDNDAVFVSSKQLPSGKGSSGGSGQNPQPGLPFLTGANMLAVKDTAKASPEMKDSDTAGRKPKSSAKSADSYSASPRSEKAHTPKQPPPNYRCDRCGQHGHLLKECPTNLDPSLDRQPPPSYKCHFCRKIGDHYGTLCPKHPHPDSIAARRRAHAKTGSRAERARRSEHLDRFRDNRAERPPDGRESHHDSPARGRDRSSSPVREAERHRYRDDYRPMDKYHSEKRSRLSHDDFSRLSLSVPRDRRCKRKASRSPSPDKVISRKKSQVWDGASVEDWSPKTVTFSDNLMGRRDDDLVGQWRGRWEGRLSYDDDDEVDEDIPQARPARRVTFAPDREGRLSYDDEEDGDVPQTRPRKRVTFSQDGWEGRLSYDDTVEEGSSHVRPARRVAFSPSEWEGRLSYDDEVEEGIPPLRPARRATFSPAVETMDVDKTEKFAPAKSAGKRCDTDGQRSELNIMEMIRAEGARTCHPLLATMFEGYKRIWVNQTVNKTRHRSADFYELCSEEDESTTSDECEVITETTATSDEAEAFVSDQEVVDSAMHEPGSLSSTKQEDDVVMEEPDLAVPAFEANLRTTARGQLMVGFKPGRAVDAEATESSLSRPADDEKMEVETPATGEVAGNSVAKDLVDAMMANLASPTS